MKHNVENKEIVRVIRVRGSTPSAPSAHWLPGQRAESHATAVHPPRKRLANLLRTVAGCRPISRTTNGELDRIPRSGPRKRGFQTARTGFERRFDLQTDKSDAQRRTGTCPTPMPATFLCRGRWSPWAHEPPSRTGGSAVRDDTDGVPYRADPYTPYRRYNRGRASPAHGHPRGKLSKTWKRKSRLPGGRSDHHGPTGSLPGAIERYDDR